MTEVIIHVITTKVTAAHTTTEYIYEYNYIIGSMQTLMQKFKRHNIIIIYMMLMFTMYA